MDLSIVVAAAENDVIGRNGVLPWRLPNDLRRFKRLTWGKPIVMGRRTHASIGRALPGRLNIVVTSHPEQVAAGCIAVESLPAARRAAGDVTELAIIGGAALYRAALPIARWLHLTRVHAAIDGDVVFPDYDPADWRIVEREHHPPDDHHAWPYTFLTLERIGPAGTC